jgi:hypothetical protein
MGWLEFMANVIESLAWPAAIAIAIVCSASSFEA